MGFTAVGVLFFILGVMLLFDLALLALGNILFVIGVVLIIGPQRAGIFFNRPQKRRGSICFVTGIVLILMKRSFLGFFIECFGILGLFGDFFAVVVQFLRLIPYVGTVLNHPVVAPVVDRLAGVQQLPV